MSHPELPEAGDLRLSSVGIETSEHVDWAVIGYEDPDYVVIPTPGPEDLEDYGFSPDELRASGEDVPADADGAIAFARGRFYQENAYDQWKDRQYPMMNYLWHCEPTMDVQDAADLMAAYAPNCCLVRFERGGETVTGIGMTAAGTDLSADIAAAYLCCGHVPPMTIMESVLRDPNHAKLPRLLAEALYKAAEWFERRSEDAAQCADRLIAVHGLAKPDFPVR